jgi:hypothetical protein
VGGGFLVMKPKNEMLDGVFWPYGERCDWREKTSFQGTWAM